MQCVIEADGFTLFICLIIGVKSAVHVVFMQELHHQLFCTENWWIWVTRMAGVSWDWRAAARRASTYFQRMRSGCRRVPAFGPRQQSLQQTIPRLSRCLCAPEAWSQASLHHNKQCSNAFVIIVEYRASDIATQSLCLVTDRYVTIYIPISTSISAAPTLISSRSYHMAKLFDANLQMMLTICVASNFDIASFVLQVGICPWIWCLMQAGMSTAILSCRNLMCLF